MEDKAETTIEARAGVRVKAYDTVEVLLSLLGAASASLFLLPKERFGGKVWQTVDQAIRLAE